MLHVPTAQLAAPCYGPLLDLLGEHYVTPKALAARWRWSEQHLANLRKRRRGPTFVKLGGSVRYPLSEVLAWELSARERRPYSVTRDALALAVASAPVSERERAILLDHLDAALFGGDSP
jgi:predicted DNA-binding transcriptional regulator AlpA